jgi:hypothetical protein
MPLRLHWFPSGTRAGIVRSTPGGTEEKDCCTPLAQRGVSAGTDHEAAARDGWRARAPATRFARTTGYQLGAMRCCPLLPEPH